jgi:hypothetical protein
MGGGLMQLVAYGAQNAYLNANPQVTFFKVVYRRHTNFSVEPIPQPWNGAADFGRVVTTTINRNGDLITNMYVTVQLEKHDFADGETRFAYVRRLGNALIQETKIEIGGSKIDEHYGDWLNIWYELTHKVGQERGYAKMIGDVAELKDLDLVTAKNYLPYYQLYVPLQFWFNRNNGLALPLIALQYHDVRVTVTFNPFLSCVNWAENLDNNSKKPTAVSMQDCELLIDYVYLDSEERKRFAQASHEYLIEQLQFTGSEAISTANLKTRLNFNHPCKYLVWAPHLENYLTTHQWVSYAFNGDWAAAADRFAKIMNLVLSVSVEIVNGGTGTDYTTLSDLVIQIADPLKPTTVSTVGDLVKNTYSLTTTANPELATILSKTEVRYVALANDATGKFLAVATADTKAGLVENLLNNAIVTRNNLTMWDITRTLEILNGLLEGVTVATFDATNAKAVLALFAVNVVDPFNTGNYLDGSSNPCINAKIQLNGHDRFQVLDGHYFNYVQPWQHFSNTPQDGVNVYSFALKAEDHQPTGTCNFSRIDNATLLTSFGVENWNGLVLNNSATANPSGGSKYVNNYLGSNSLLNIYTVNYNVLRVMSGMAGLAYSN